MDEIPEYWWTGPGNYTGDDCRNCGRERVLLVDAPDGTECKVCEKCGWDQSEGCYAVELDIRTPDTQE